MFAVLAVSALGGGYETVREAHDESKFVMPGQLIDVGDHRLHINCTGSGTPTVVLEGGLGEPSTTMAAWIAPQVAATTTVCVYDRAGYGWSESASSPQDGLAVATDLHTLLTRAHAKPPFVLAGHSSGGPYVEVYAATYPDEVAGVVLLDSQPADDFAKLPGYASFYSKFRKGEALVPSLARLGLMRLFYSRALTGLPPQTRAEERAFWSTADNYRTMHDEIAELPTSLTQAQALTSLGDLPLIVITAGKDAQAGWLPLQNEMAALSTNSLHWVMPNVSHTSLTEDQGDSRISSRAIIDVVQAVRSGVPLTNP